MSTIQLHREDELDQLLHDFFKSEMPASFPKLNLPEQPLRKAQPTRSFLSSRFALAASILLLLLAACSCRAPSRACNRRGRASTRATPPRRSSSRRYRSNNIMQWGQVSKPCPAPFS